MHEYSIVSSMISLCEKQALEAKAKEIKSVTIQIGKLSGVEAHFMENCFDYFKEDTICKNAKLNMKIVDIKIECKECSEQTIVTNNNYLCPKCNSKETSLISGKELFIESIEIT